MLIKWKNSVLKKTYTVFLKTHLLTEVLSKVVKRRIILTPLYPIHHPAGKGFKTGENAKSREKGKAPSRLVGMQSVLVGLTSKLECGGVELIVVEEEF